jgi:hypothetical protein
MMKQIIRKVKFFGAWQDEKEEAWLEEMALQGLLLKEVGFPLVYGFEEGTPGRVAYRLDYTSLRSEDREDYFQLFNDAGWEWLGEMSGWQYFRKPVEAGEKPEIFTDNQSKVEKYQRVLMFLVILLPIYLPVLSGFEGDSLFFDVLMVFIVALFLIYLYAILMLISRIGQMKKKL